MQRVTQRRCEACGGWLLIALRLHVHVFAIYFLCPFGMACVVLYGGAGGGLGCCPQTRYRPILFYSSLLPSACTARVTLHEHARVQPTGIRERRTVGLDETLLFLFLIHVYFLLFHVLVPVLVSHICICSLRFAFFFCLLCLVRLSTRLLIPDETT